MLSDLDRNEWGQGYRLVVKMTNMKRPHRLTNEQQVAEATKLFPSVVDVMEERVMTAGQPRSFSQEELREATERIRSGKAPGPDGVLPEIAKVTVRCQPELFLAIANRTLTDANFPKTAEGG